MMVFAYISTSLWDAIDRTYILQMTGEKTLGVFAFAGTLCAGLITVATSISQVFHPRIAMLYGSSGKSMAACFRYCLKCSLLGAVVMVPLVALTCWLVDPFVKMVLPKYIESIPITRYLCWLSLIPVIDLPGQLLIIGKRTKQLGISVIIGFTAFLLMLAYIAFLDDQISLQKIVITSVACKMVTVFTSNFFAWHLAHSERHTPEGPAHEINV